MYKTKCLKHTIFYDYFMFDHNSTDAMSDVILLWKLLNTDQIWKKSETMDSIWIKACMGKNYFCQKPDIWLDPNCTWIIIELSLTNFFIFVAI